MCIRPCAYNSTESTEPVDFITLLKITKLTRGEKFTTFYFCIQYIRFDKTNRLRFQLLRIRQSGMVKKIRVISNTWLMGEFALCKMFVPKQINSVYIFRRILINY